MAKNSILIPENKSFLLLTLIIFISLVLLLASLSKIQFAVSADEGYYFSYARYISDNGVKSFPNLFKFFLADGKHWLYPSPLRIGYILIASLFVKILGNSYFSLVALSISSFYLFILVTFIYIKKYFNERMGLFLASLLAFSPLCMAMARRALTDSTANMFVILSLWLFFDMVRECKISKTAFFVLTYSLTILIRESTVLLSFFFILYLLIRKKIFSANIRLTDLFSVTLFPFLIVSIVYLLTSSNNIESIIKIAGIIGSQDKNPYNINFGSGPWFRYIIDFMMLSPLVAILSTGYFFYYFLKNNRHKEEISYLLLFIISLIFIFNFFPKNVRYLIFLDMPIRLAALLMVYILSEQFFKKVSLPVITSFIILISISDYINFYRLFIENSIYDPVSCWLLQATRIIPK